MKFINYIKYLFGWSAYLGFTEWAKRDRELCRLFLKELKKDNYDKAQLLHRRINSNYYMWKDSSNLKSDLVDAVSNIKPKDFKI